MPRRQDYSLIVHFDEEEQLYWGYIEGYPSLTAHGDTFLECIAELDLLIDTEDLYDL